MQPETKEEGELKESKETEMPVTFDTALEQMRAALNHADEAAQFLRENLAPVYHVQEEVQIQQQDVVGHGDNASDHSSETLPSEAFERGSLGSSQGTVDQLAPPPPDLQGNAAVENDPQLQHFTGRIIGGTHAQIGAYTFHRDNAQAAEGRRDWSGAHLHWMSAVNRAANEMRTIENHQQENNEVHHNPTVAESLTQGHAQWMQLQNIALARAQQANANDRCCTIS